MSEQIHSTKLQDKMERNVWAMLLMLIVLLSIGGIVEIVPLYYLDNTMEHNARPEILWQRGANQTMDDWNPGDGVRPYTGLELAGRAVYIREGCYLCHSQMIRPFRDEKERYGHYSLATESIYDHPFQWGSKRTGPDLARVGGKYSDEWHRNHLIAPRSVVPESVMPNYPWLMQNTLDSARVASHLKGMQRLGVPYTDSDIESQAAKVSGLTEMDAMIAYLQVLGTMVRLDYGVQYRE
ncbi:MAG: cytochrome-c oxidase, cbb3-type subunit II [Gammaproteobacteria bacterium]|nr:cytochrome-c oxidase, cbb3-type subunit II [Gammaproteobacteria bacterium]